MGKKQDQKTRSTYHCLFHPKSIVVIGAGNNILKPGGRVVLVEWDEEEKPLGPPLRQRVNRKAAEDIFLKTGFHFEKEFDAGENHYGLILKKP